MFLSQDALYWAIVHLKTNCHPFLGITFLASKRAGIPNWEDDRNKPGRNNSGSSPPPPQA